MPEIKKPFPRGKGRCKDRIRLKANGKEFIYIF